MIELLRNCSHGSEIATYLVYNGTSMEKIIKVATTPAGIRNLEYEYEGWSWYQKIRYSQIRYPMCRIIQRNRYIKIEIEFILGSKVNYKRGLEKNVEIIKKVIEHYCHIWPYYSNIVSPIHGDLSLDNIICNSKGIHIIDWEHFNLKGAPWGFDAFYLLFETLYFGIRKGRQPSQKELTIIADNISFLNHNNQLPYHLIEHPLKFIKDFITDNSQLWGEQLMAFPQKLPILTFTDGQISLIDNMVFSKLREQV